MYVCIYIHIDLGRDLAISYDEHDEGSTKGWQVYVCVYVSRCIYVYVYIRIYVHDEGSAKDWQVYSNTYAYAFVYAGGLAGTRIHTQIRVPYSLYTTYNHTYACAYVTYKCAHASMYRICTRISVYACVYATAVLEFQV
jgi:hypothetical protein